MSPYRTIWLSPTKTFDVFVINHKSQPLFVVPAFLMGLVYALDSMTWMTFILGDENVLAGFALSLAYGMALAAVIFGIIFPGLIKLTAKIWKAPATMRQVVNVCLISLMPQCIALFFQVMMMLFGEEPALYRIGAIHYILDSWSMSLLIIGISRVQKFTYGMALVNIFLGWIIVSIVALIGM